MNFQHLKTIEKPDFYLDVAFRKAKKKAEASRELSKKDRFMAQKSSEFVRIETVSRYLKAELTKILKSYPSIDDLPEFYNELIRLTLDYRQLKKSLGALNWAQKKVSELTKVAVQKNTKTHDQRRFLPQRNEFYGRISSVFKQIRKELEYLEFARKTMKGYPNIKTGIMTVAFCGYPNVGKSSLLASLTTAKPEVNVYPFTTKTINIGYMKETIKVRTAEDEKPKSKERKIQLVDVPGLFSRSKLNDIEMLSYLVLKHVADTAFFLFDCSPQKSYDIKDQLRLYKKIKKEFALDLNVVVSKSDITQDKEIPEEIKKLRPLRISSQSGSNLEKVRRLIIGSASEKEEKGKEKEKKDSPESS